jgi:hypothetical protein
MFSDGKTGTKENLQPGHVARAVIDDMDQWIHARSEVCRAHRSEDERRTAAAHDNVGRAHNAGEEPMRPDGNLPSLIEASWSAGRLPRNAPGRQEP